MKILDFAKRYTVEKLRWDGDNREFVVQELLPQLHVRKEVAQVIRWAYGYDGSDRSYEQESDGSSIVPDRFMLGLIKEPPGTAHDYLNRVAEHRTPDGHKWTCWQSCVWYRKALEDFGYPRWLACIRGLAIAITGSLWWR